MSDVFNTVYPLLHIDGVLHQFGQNCIAQHETKKKHSICVFKVYQKVPRMTNVHEAN